MEAQGDSGSEERRKVGEAEKETGGKLSGF